MHGNRSEFGHRGLPALAAGLDWNVLYDANSVVLEVAAAGLAGDYNGGGTVDAADYVMWSGISRPGEAPGCIVSRNRQGRSMLMDLRPTTNGKLTSGVLAFLVAMIGVLLGAADSASASLLVYESFDYDAGTVLDDGTAATGLNLAGDYTSDTISSFELVVQSPGLDYGSLSGVPSVAGNRLIQTLGTTAGEATVSVDQDVVINPGEAIYFSALFTLDDTGNLNRLANITFTDEATGDELSFGEPSVGVRAIRVEANTAATGQLITDGADGSFTDGQTLFLVGRYVNSATANDDSLELLGYNTADADVLPGSFDPTDPNAEFAYGLADRDIDFAKITSINFRIRGTANNFIDELRIGSTYASVVVPEPATVVLLVGGMCSAAVQAVSRERAFRRRK